MRAWRTAACALALALAREAGADVDALGRPRHPWLAGGLAAMTHFEPAQQDSLAVAGPTGMQEIGWDRIQRLPGGLGNGVLLDAPPYADGTRVLWTVNASRVAKIRVDGGRFEELARWEIPGQPRLDAAEADRITAALDAAEGEAELVGWIRAHYPYWLERVAARSGVYSMLSRDGEFYTFVRDRIVVLGDARPGDPRSPIAVRREWPVPAEILSDWSIRWLVAQRWWRGELGTREPRPSLTQAFEILRDTGLGLGMTWDGRVVLSTVSGAVAVIDREFVGPPSWLRLGGEMITNSFAVDEDGGIYVVTDQRMHKLVWTGERLSQDPGDGAWSSPYERARGDLGGIRAGSQGSGATPSLLGFAPGEDRLVVITDGAEPMHLVAFWRDEIPADATPPIGALSPRIADQIRVEFGRREPGPAQSEQSVAVWGDGAFVVNNSGPDSLGSAFENVVAIGVTRPPPRGVERFRWDAGTNRWVRVWARPDVASPSMVPLVSAGSRQAYVQSAEGGVFAFVGLDWETGRTCTRLELPRTQAMNGAYMLIQLLPDGDLVTGMLTGPVRIDAGDPVSAPAAPPSPCARRAPAPGPAAATGASSTR